MARSELTIGVDGGATEVKAHEVLVLPREVDGPRLALGGASASARYELLPGFEPVPLELQIEQHARGAPSIGPLEDQQGERWLAATEACVLAIAAGARGKRVTLGVCLPGTKTAGRRGTAIVRNGPRVPDFLDRLEFRLARAGLDVARPIAPLVGDGEACGLGERAAEQGHWRGIRSAYYVGGGTGVAECLLLEGRVTSFDALEGRLAKAWQMRDASGRSYDDLVSLGGLNRAFAAHAQLSWPLRTGEFPEERALARDATAIELLETLAGSLADLVVQRLASLHGGCEASTGGRPVARGTVLERVVIGQRLGTWLAEERLRDVLRAPLERALAERIARLGAVELEGCCLAEGGLRPGFLVASSLRAAPAIGAIAHALGFPDPSS